MDKPLTLGAIDAGSNAIRVSIAQASGPGEFSFVVNERVPVRLGHHAFTRHELDAPTIDSAVQAFAWFRQLFDQHGVEHYRATATSAVRNVRNRERLLHRLFHEANIDLEVIDGEEEARLVRRAVLHAFAQAPGNKTPSAIVDLGGGSLEVTTGGNGSWETASMHIGTVRLMESFALRGEIPPAEADLLSRYVTSHIDSSVPMGHLDEGDWAAACGGNAEALATFFGDLDPETNMRRLSAEALAEALPKLLKANVDKRMAKYSVRKDRAEVMGIAAIVFNSVCVNLNLAGFLVPEVGLRHGLLLELSDSYIEAGAAISREDALIASARSFASRLGHDTSHGEQVQALARSLFHQLTELHGLPETACNALEVAAILHDVGEVVNRKSHHKTGEYLVLHGRIPGLEGDLRQVVAAMVRTHRKSLPSSKKHESYALLGKEEREQVRKLGAILRIADAIDTDHRQRVVELRAEVIPYKKAKKDGRMAEVLFHIVVEQEKGEAGHLVRRKADAFCEEYNCDVNFDVDVVPATPRRTAVHSE